MRDFAFDFRFVFFFSFLSTSPRLIYINVSLFAIRQVVMVVVLVVVVVAIMDLLQMRGAILLDRLIYR